MTTYVLQGRYPGPHGWEDLCAEDTRAEALLIDKIRHG
jgi:hypothetical protein